MTKNPLDELIINPYVPMTPEAREKQRKQTEMWSKKWTKMWKKLHTISAETLNRRFGK